jgi:hypothetical protein
VATSPTSPAMIVSQVVSERPKKLADEFVGEGLQLVVQVPKATSMFGAPASFEFSGDNPHAASIVER